MTDTPTIATLAIIDGKPNQAGNRLLAVFDLIISGMRIHGCALHESSEGIAFTNGPTGKHYTGTPVKVKFVDRAVSRAITRQACAAYTAMSGIELCDE
ncbi:hypothetical protein [Shimia sediminis]|uniref:hypothetical protein n=1 Tax=Shimia sediminis TaxID=2497945 RepID=UPI000F8DC8B2|nr:hypothetical protein [Shimia sediminis]